jgi:hypothetical protein
MPKRPITIIFAARAKLEIDEAQAWWAQNRGTHALADAVATVLERLQAFPQIAPRVQINGTWSTTRRAAVDPVG